MSCMAAFTRSFGFKRTEYQKFRCGRSSCPFRTLHTNSTPMWSVDVKKLANFNKKVFILHSVCGSQVRSRVFCGSKISTKSARITLRLIRCRTPEKTRSGPRKWTNFRDSSGPNWLKFATWVLHTRHEHWRGGGVDAGKVLEWAKEIEGNRYGSVWSERW